MGSTHIKKEIMVAVSSSSSSGEKTGQELE